MFPWDDARFFLAIHRTGSLTLAARELGVNQSTVSRRLAALEEGLGTRLFVRSPEGYFASPTGERLVARAERMEEEATAIAREATGQAQSLKGTVRITAPDAFGPFFLVPLLAELRAKEPQIEVELVPENRLFNLTKREADMAVRVGRPVESLVVARHVADMGMALYASTAYVKAHGRPRGDDLSGHELVGFDESLQSTGDARWLAARSKGASMPFRTTSTYAQLRAAVAGMGIALLPCYLADGVKGLVRVRSPRTTVALEIWILLHPDLRHTARIRTTADFLATALAARKAELLGR